MIIRRMSDQEVEEMKALILSDRKARRGPFSREVRERVQGYLKEKWRSGRSLKVLGTELGLSDHTVQYWRARWGEREEAQPKLRRVKVVKEKRQAWTKSRVTMHGPCGTRIEGLHLDEVAALLRRLS